MGNACKFEPSCSEYSQQAFLKFKPHKASYLTLKRLCKCHPFCEGGYDPLPIKEINHHG